MPIQIDWKAHYSRKTQDPGKLTRTYTLKPLTFWDFSPTSGTVKGAVGIRLAPARSQSNVTSPPPGEKTFLFKILDDSKLVFPAGTLNRESALTQYFASDSKYIHIFNIFILLSTIK